MANLVFDFLHHYQTGERRASDPADAYQYDEGHVMEAVVPVEVASCEIHYWVRGQEEAEAYVPDSITQNEDGSYSIIGHIPNTFFETYGELRVYIVVTDGTASITTYEGRIHICERSKPDDYVDNDPENEATRVLNEAREAAATATAAAQTAQDVADSIPADYSQMSEDVSQLKEDFSSIENDIYTTTDNLFNFDEINANKVPGSIGSSPDAFVSLNNWYTSNYIPVTEGEQYALIYLNTITQGAIFRIAGYSNGIMTYKTSGSTEPNPFTIPAGVDHVRFYSNTTNLFNNRTNTSFKKYSADTSMTWAPYGKQENYLVKGAMPEYGVYVDGTNYYHFVRFGKKTLIRRFKQEGPNNLFQFSALYTGEVSEHGVSIDKTIATNGTDTVGPISIMRQGVDSGGMWTGGWHTRTVNGVACPTAEQESLDIKINGESIVGVDGLHYGECVATVVNKLYFAQTITGADLSTATQAIQETVTYVLNEKMTARVAHKYVADTRVILYYGMQAVRIGFDNILLPNNETSFAFADMTANINIDKPEDLMQMSNNDWNYDLIVKPFGLAKYTHNSGAGATKYGYLPTATRKVYWALMEGTYEYTFITSGKVLVWEGVWDIYPN